MLEINKNVRALVSTTIAEMTMQITNMTNYAKANYATNCDIAKLLYPEQDCSGLVAESPELITP